MKKKIWIGLIVIIGIMLTTISGPVCGAELAMGTNEPMLYGRSLASQWTGEIMGNYLNLNPSAEIIPWENRKMGMAVIPYLKSKPQWNDIPADISRLSSDDVLQKILQSRGPGWSQNWEDEEIFYSEDLFSTTKENENQTEEEDNTSELPPLPNALWICGFGIIGILSVRRTNEQSNMK